MYIAVLLTTDFFPKRMHKSFIEEQYFMEGWNKNQ